MQVFSNIYLLRDICGLNCELDNVACSKDGLWDVLKLRIQPGQEVSEEIFDICVQQDNIRFLAWLTDNNVKGCTADTLDLAAITGNLEMVKWLHENRPERCTTLAMEFVALNGHLDIIEFLVENKFAECTNMAINFAKVNEHLDIVKFLSTHETSSAKGIKYARNLLVGNDGMFVVVWNPEEPAVKLGETGLSLSCDVSERMPKNLSGYRTNGCTVNVAPCSSGMTFEWLAKNKKRGLSLWAFPLQTVHCGNISPVLCYGGLKTEFIEN